MTKPNPQSIALVFNIACILAVVFKIVTVSTPLFLVCLTVNGLLFALSRRG